MIDSTDDSAGDPIDESLFLLRRQRDASIKQLRFMLSRADAPEIFRLLWSIDAIGRNELAIAYKNGPRLSEQQLKDVQQSQLFQPWNVESLANEYLLARRIGNPKGKMLKKRTLNCMVVGTYFSLLNTLHSLENYEDAIWLKQNNIMNMLGPLSQRQFPWQRGVASYPEYYRSTYIYGFKDARNLFLSRYGFSMEEFIKTGFCLWALFRNRPFANRDINLESIAIDSRVRDEIIRHISEPIESMRIIARDIRGRNTLSAYKPSVLRQKPIIRLEKNGLLVAPLPDLIGARVSSGLFYDLAGQEGSIRNAIGAQFENYVFDLIAANISDVSISREFKYSIGKNTFDSPDLFLNVNDKTEIVIECKAKKAPHGVKFSDHPASIKDQLFEIGKGVFQVWRHLFRIRNGIITSQNISDSTTGMVVTLDTWVEMSDLIRSDVFDIARSIAREKEPMMTESHQAPVAVVHIHDLEATLVTATRKTFVSAVNKLARSPTFAGWHLESVHREEPNRKPNRKAGEFFGAMPELEIRAWI